ncbi:Hypothetical predicted protein, partial [Paramuricea clavata]
GRGVLQGDCLSPLLFNMSFNTFIQHIKSEKYRQLGFWKSSENGTPLNPLHWFQFADDAAVVSGQEKENQMLLNRFTIWCQWAQMIIRVDKCSTFGIRKQVTKSIQYLPKLFINNCLVPRVEFGKSFRYLGRYFDFNMSDEDHKSEVYDTLTNILNEIDDLPLHPKNKILLYSSYVLAKISWHFTLSDIGKTWVNDKLDSIASTYIRKWLELPISATLKSLLHVVAGCKTYLNEGRFTWRHDSVLNFIASILKSVNHCNLYADLPGYISPSVITGDELRPDLLITLENKCIYILELTVGFESNLLTNATQKRQKYQDLINEQLKNYEKVKFVNLSISSLGVFSHPSLDFTEMLKDLKFDKQRRKYYVRKIINICIRSSYYIFCKRNKEWDNPQLMSY